MLKNFKYYTLVLLSALLVFTSCMNNDDDDIPEESGNTLAEEAALLQQYVAALVANGNDLDTTDVGVVIVDMEAGEGDFVSVGDSIGIEYAGFFLNDNNPFDSSANIEGGVYRFRQVDGVHIVGFYDALFHLNKGAIGTFLLPSNIAYGTLGARDPFGNIVIPSNTPIVFQIKLVDIYEKASEI